MAYCTIADLNIAFHPENIIRWADDDRDGVLSAPELAIVTATIARAQAVVDGKLNSRYAVPLAEPVPAQVKEATMHVAGFLLAKRRGFVSAHGDMQAATIVGDRDDAMRWLDEVRKGESDIPGLTSAQPIILSTTTGVQPVMSDTQFDSDGRPIPGTAGSLDGFERQPSAGGNSTRTGGVL